MAYRFLKYLMTLSIKLFYRRLTVRGRKRIPEKGPVILAANHPNTLMDPLVVGIVAPQRIGFVAKSTIFVSRPLIWFLNRFHVIPVYRREDFGEGRRDENLQSFVRVNEYLQKGGSLLIFPEGVSYAEMKLRQLRSGTARMALNYAANLDFQSGLKVVPVSIHYYDPSRFRTDLFVQVGEPIAADDYADDWKEDPLKAARTFTAEIGKRLKAGMITLEGEQEEALLKMVRIAYRDALEEAPSRTDLHADFLYTQAIAEGIAYLRKENPPRLHRLTADAEAYFDALDSAGLQSRFFSGRHSRRRLRWEWWNAGLNLLFGFPLWLAGTLINVIPYLLPSRIAPLITDEIQFRAPIMMLAGVLLFPLFWGLWLLLAILILAPPWWAVLLMGAALPLSGIIALHYGDVWSGWRSLGAFLSLSPGERGHVAALREQIVQEIESVRAEMQD